MFVVCCLLLVGCVSLSVVVGRCLWFVGCSWLVLVCCSLFDVCCLLFVRFLSAGICCVCSLCVVG